MSEAVPHSRIDHVPFDGAASWSRLPPAVQARIGAAALEYVVAAATYRHAHEPVGRAAEEADALAGEFLIETVVGYGDEGLPDREWCLSEKAGGTFRLPSILGRVCLVCGCSQHDGCPQGCGWHSDYLCTACSGPAVPATSDSHAVVQARLIETSHRIRDGKGLPRLGGEEILGRAPPPAPDLAPEDVRAVCRGACRAVVESPLADVPPPSGDGLAALASAIDRMYEADLA